MEFFDSPQARLRAPTNGFRWDGKFELRPPFEKRLKRAFARNTRQLVAQAEMDSGAEGQVPIGPPRQIQLLGMGIGIGIALR